MINATLIDININFGIDSNINRVIIKDKKTPSNVYDVVYKSFQTLKTLLEDRSYEN